MSVKTLPTWAGRSRFMYSGSVAAGVHLTFGDGWKAHISALAFQHLLTYFGGRTVDAGTSRTQPPRGSLGEWLVTNVDRRATASYVAAILVHEGYATKSGSKITIKGGTSA